MGNKIKKLIFKEEKRQRETLNLIASENYIPKNIRDVLSSRLSNKYSEGYPGKRYYAGNEYIDEIEKLARKNALELFGLKEAEWSVNVQPLSGTPANLAVYFALVPLNGKIMAQCLDCGGHLSHGSPLSITSKLWKWVHYTLDKKTQKLDYNAILSLAKKEKPKLIVAGVSAYSRIIDFKKIGKIAEKIGAYLMVDMSHIAGLVAGKVYPSPFPCADVVTTTTHKTLRGPRGAIIFANRKSQIAKRADINIVNLIDKAVFPGLQGGPHNQQTAAIALCLEEAKKPAFKKYVKQVVKNAKTLAEELRKKDFKIVSGGTDSHLFLIDLIFSGLEFGGKQAQERLEKGGIILNMNIIPFDEKKARDPSGIRIGTPAITSRGMKEKEMKTIAGWISEILKSPETDLPIVQRRIKKEVEKLCRAFPIL